MGHLISVHLNTSIYLIPVLLAVNHQFDFTGVENRGSMSKESRKFRVPDQLANLYDFANSLDLRCFKHRGEQHVPGDELTGPQELQAWMSARRLLRPGDRTTSATLQAARALRSCIRGYLELEPAERRTSRSVLRSLNSAAALFPLVVETRDGGGMRLRPAGDDARAGLAVIIAELYDGAASGALDRLKTCAAEECRRVFFDRSKPGSRRWCVSALCGNRIKTRTYRARHQEA
jgi:predicted RNA-binding Zn ribbon-like protein